MELVVELFGERRERRLKLMDFEGVVGDELEVEDVTKLNSIKKVVKTPTRRPYWAWSFIAKLSLRVLMMVLFA